MHAVEVESVKFVFACLIIQRIESAILKIKLQNAGVCKIYIPQNLYKCSSVIPL